MAVLELFAPSLSFFDDVYGADMDLFPVSLDTEFYAASGDAAMRFSCRCTCDVGDGGWCQKAPGSGEDWVQIPLAEDAAATFYLE